MDICHRYVLDPWLLGRDVEHMLCHMLAMPPFSAVELRVIRPQPGFEARRAADPAGPGLDPVHNDTDTRPPMWLQRGATLPEVGPDEVLCFTSSVSVVGHGLRHLLLLDFRVPVSVEAQRDLERHLTALGWHGLLAVTGSSYHFLGVEALVPRTWEQRMHQSLLIPGIDWRYIGHSLIRGAGAARFTACALKPTRPYIVAIINPSLTGRG